MNPAPDTVNDVASVPKPDPPADHKQLGECMLPWSECRQDCQENVTFVRLHSDGKGGKMISAVAGGSLSEFLAATTLLDLSQGESDGLLEDPATVGKLPNTAPESSLNPSTLERQVKSELPDEGCNLSEQQ